MFEAKLSFYQSKLDKEGKNIGISDYVNFVREGANQDDVIKGRALKQKGKEEDYKKLKSNTLCVTGSCTMQFGKSKEMANIESMNGLIVMDFDEDQVTPDKYQKLKDDKYTFIIHESFGGGQNYCVFVKIDPLKFLESFLGLSEYYSNSYGLSVDQSCKNKNRLRFLSYDRYIHVNDKSLKFVAKDIKRQKPIPKEKSTFVYLDSDFDNILSQIEEKGIDLCKEDYFRYLNIGLSLANKFGEEGRQYFHRICMYGGKYNDQKADRDYTTYIKQNNGGRTIATIYYYAKEEGLEVYSDRTKEIINRVKSAKTFGVPSVEGISKTLETLTDVQTTEDEKQFINTLINDKTDYSILANEGVTEIEQLERFILDNYSPYEDEISKYVYLSDKRATTKELNSIYIAAKKTFDFKVSKDDIRSIIYSSSVRQINPLIDFLRENEGLDPKGYIDAYIGAVETTDEKAAAYNRWAFKKWIVGCLHNWTMPFFEEEVSPLTLVLTGQDHGSGKTSFFRNILPKCLRTYYKEGKVSAHEKDSTYLLCSCLVLLDDEFGGKAFKDDKEFKGVSDSNIITQRRPYGTEIEDFKRRAGLCGTSNILDIIKDITGNRRILPINVSGKIDYNLVKNFDVEKMIIEAYNLLKSGFEWKVYSDTDKAYIKENTSENEAVLPFEELFFRFFKTQQDANYNTKIVLNQSEILETFSGSKFNNKPTKYDLKEVLVKNKISYKLHRLGENEFKKGMLLYIKSYDVGDLGLSYAVKTNDPQF